MQASVHVVMTKCELRYIQLAMSSSNPVPCPRLHRLLDEHVQSSARVEMSRACAKAAIAPVDRPRTSR